MFLLLNGQLCYNWFPPLWGPVESAAPVPVPRAAGVQGARLTPLCSWSSQPDRNPRHKAGQSVPAFPSWNEQDRSLQRSSLLRHRWLPLPSTSCMEDGLGQNFPKHSHLFHKEHGHLAPCPQRQRGSKVSCIPSGEQMPRSHCGLGPEDLNLIQQLIRIRNPRHFWKFYLS